LTDIRIDTNKSIAIAIRISCTTTTAVFSGGEAKIATLDAIPRQAIELGARAAISSLPSDVSQ